MVKNPFKDMAIAISGDFGEGKSAENFKRWIASGGGKFVSTLTEETTHLICTESDWKKKTSTVKEAIKMNTIKIVNFDWLEDSLRLGRCFKEQKYLMEALHTKKSRQSKGGLSCDSKVTKCGRSSNSELASVFISHLNEYQGSRKTGGSGPRHTGAAKRASDSAIVKGSRKAKEKGKKNQERLVVTMTCPRTAVDLLEAHLRERKEKLLTAGQNADTQLSSTPDLLIESADDETTTLFARTSASREANEESVNQQLIRFDSADPPMSDHSFTGPESINHEASQPCCSVVPSKRNTLPSSKKPPQGNSSRDSWLPMDLSKYHIFKDDSGFEYNVTLIRIDIRRNSNERFVLRLYESHRFDLLPASGDETETVVRVEPGAEAEVARGASTYAMWLQFVSDKNGGEPVVQCLAAEGSEFEIAMGAFKYAFKTWTGRRWEERDKTVKSGGSERDDSGLEEQVEEHCVNWDDRVTAAAGLPRREDTKSKPFMYVKPGGCPRSKRAYGLGGMPVVARYATQV